MYFIVGLFIVLVLIILNKKVVNKMLMAASSKEERILFSIAVTCATCLAIIFWPAVLICLVIYRVAYGSC